MKSFDFVGSLPASKSILNRALIIQNHFPQLKIHGDSRCDDVTFMKDALVSLQAGSSIDCGEGGTTLRFLTLRVSRLSGEFFLQAHPRLMKRPQQELITTMQALGVSAQLEKEGIRIVSKGWQKPQFALQVASGDSSQYASALLLNAWNLNFDLEFILTGSKVSESYFSMTLQMVQKLGMQVHREGDKFTVPAGQVLKTTEYAAEPDLSSAFVFAAAGALCGRSEILNFPSESLQPDQAFVQAFQQMNISCRLQRQILITEQASSLRPLQFNLSQSPDLFPVLATLCSFAEGTSHLYGAPHLAFKESNRIQKVADLFDLVGIRYESKSDGMIIHGKKYPIPSQTQSYDTAHDHRMVMAAALLKKAGFHLNILYPESVHKSLPEFFELFRETP